MKTHITSLLSAYFSFHCACTANAAVIKTSPTIDQVFVMDCTGSMGSYIQTAKTKILELVSKISADHPTMDLRLAFVGYRDITDWQPDQPQTIEIPFTTDYNSFKNDLERLASASGGGDLPEDVYTGLAAAGKLKWAGDIRSLTLLADAPHNERAGREPYSAFKPVLQDMASQAMDAKAVFSFGFFDIDKGATSLGEQLKSMMPEGVSFQMHDLSAPASPMHRPMPPMAAPYFEPRSKMHTGMDRIMPSYDYSSYEPVEMALEMAATTESMELATESMEMTKEHVPKSGSSYMDTVAKDIRKAVEKYAEMGKTVE